MNKLYILTGIIILQNIATVNAADFQNRPASYLTIDRLVENDPIQWPAIFSALDNMRGTFDVNRYITPETHLQTTLLDTAVFDRNLFATEKLLKEFNANPNLVKDFTKITPLMIACMGPTANPAIVRVLIKYGANPYLQNRHGQNSFHFAGDKIKIMAELDQYKRKNR